MSGNNLWDPHQSAYRPNHSTESALIKVKNDIMFALDKGHVVLILSLDLSAAFDTIDREILISRLSSRVGVRKTALNWFKSYLDDWTTCVEINGRQSSTAVNSIGLPQGSVFGPIGYTIYSLPISDIAKSHNVSYHTYADDTQLYLTFDPKESNGLETALRTLSACVMDIKAWMCRNKLKLNEGKTEFLVVGSPQNIRNLNNVCLNLGTTKIIPSTSMKNLGVYFDSSMSMSDQIYNICKSVRFQLKNVSQIRKYITRDACNHAVRSHVISRLDYCNGLLTEVPSVQLRRLQSLQNWAARIIFKVDRRHDPTPLLKSLHWLPVKERIMFKILLLVYKSFHDQAPIYIKNCLELYQPLRPNLRSSTDLFRICCPRTRTKAGDRTFTVTAAKAWNKLPTLIKSANSLEIFKKLLKTHLFPKT